MTDPAPASDELLVDGLAWACGIDVYGKTAVVDERVGQGPIVLFGFDPNHRAFTNGTAQLLLARPMESRRPSITRGLSRGRRVAGVGGFRVDLGGLAADEHPWAQEQAVESADLRPQVLASRLP